MKPLLVRVLLVSTAAVTAAAAAAATVSVEVARRGPCLELRLDAIFLEEINHGVDGGLYAELVRNRTPVGQHVLGSIEINRWYDLRIELASHRIRCHLDGQLIQTAKLALPAQKAGVADLMWALTMLPEFQLIY